MILSSKQVAGILGVNESSVKRWADSGMLNCYRTPGGHRKFRREDILSFSRKYEYELRSDIANEKAKHETSEEINPDTASRVLFNKLLTGTEDEILDYTYSLYMSGTGITDLYDNVVSKAMAEIGYRWKRKEISIEQEHIATNKLVKALIRLQGKLTAKPGNGLKALCASLEGEFHELPVLMVGNALEYHGWKVIYAGVNLPVKALKSGINEFRPDIVCISSTIIGKKDNYLNAIKKVYETVIDTGAKLILGGAGMKTFNGNSPKADMIINNTNDLIKYLRKSFRV